jgi:hypothetical protein
MRLAVTVMALGAGMLLSLPAWAATVESVQGQVSINRGDGFRPVTGAIQANVGDTVMASPGGRAKIVYSDGCPVNVNPGAVVTITAESPCTAFAQAAPNDGQYYWVGGAIILGGTGVLIACITAFCKSSNSAPASP